MCAEDASSPIAPNSQEQEGNRKLWFDYLVKVNDRSLQRSSASGATTWVLLGVAAAIVYKGFPELPRVLALPGIIHSTLTAFVLEADTVCFCGSLILLVLAYVKGEEERRLLPETLARESKVVYSFLMAGLILFIFLHVITTLKVSDPLLVKILIAVLGLVLLLIAAYGVSQFVVNYRKARKHKLPVPQFSPSVEGKSALLSLLIVFPFFVASLIALWAYLRFLSRIPGDWRTPLTAATYILVLCGICLELFGRAVSSSSRAPYEVLERAIVVEHLSPDEIRSRFVKQLLGARGADWLKSQMEIQNDADIEFASKLEALELRFTRLGDIDAEFALERNGRTHQLLTEFDAATNDWKEAMKRIGFHILSYPSVNITKEEISIVQGMAAEFKGAKLESRKALGAKARALKQKLTNLVSWRPPLSIAFAGADSPPDNPLVLY